MRSARRDKAIARAAILGVCGALAAGALSGCQTTQDTAAAKKAESEQFLKEREAKRAKKQHDKKKGGEQ